MSTNMDVLIWFQIAESAEKAERSNSEEVLEKFDSLKFETSEVWILYIFLLCAVMRTLLIKSMILGKSCVWF